MEVAKQSNTDNDYAVAKVLNEHVAALISAVVMAEIVGLPENFELKDINRAYVLLADELQKIYARNPELSAIDPKPIWSRFDVLQSSTWEINEHFEDPDNTELLAHIARVDRLCIISGKETPDLSPEQTKLVDYADTTWRKYAAILEEAKANKKARIENDWHISEYTLAYKPDGTILVNDVLKLKKAHAGAATERVLEQALKSPYELFKPDLGQTSRNLSTVLSGAGFTPVLRQLFFPIVSNDKGIVFRPTITREQADADNIDTTELDLKLKELGANTQSGIHS